MSDQDLGLHRRGELRGNGPAAAVLAVLEVPADALLERRVRRHPVRFVPGAIEFHGVLTQHYPAHLAEIVRLRYYVGLTAEETAGVVGVSVSTLKRDWRYARAWLARRLGEGSP